MTKEEAVEIILKGGPWVVCDTCDASGQVRIEGGKGTDSCQTCDGYASFMNPDYVEACYILGMEVPTIRTAPFAHIIPLTKILEMTSMKDTREIEERGFKIVIEGIVDD